MSTADYKHIVRIMGKDVEGDKKITVALSKVKGVGYNFAQVLLQKLNINPYIRVGLFTNRGGVVRELAVAFRALRLTPAISLAVILSLSFGLGTVRQRFRLSRCRAAHAACRESERLVVMSKGPATTRQMFSYATWEAVRDLTSDFEGAIAWSDLRKG